MLPQQGHTKVWNNECETRSTQRYGGWIQGPTGVQTPPPTLTDQEPEALEGCGYPNFYQIIPTC